MNQDYLIYVAIVAAVFTVIAIVLIAKSKKNNPARDALAAEILRFDEAFSALKRHYGM